MRGLSPPEERPRIFSRARTYARKHGRREQQKTEESGARGLPEPPPHLQHPTLRKRRTSSSEEDAHGEEAQRAEATHRDVPRMARTPADPAREAEAARMAPSDRVPVLDRHIGHPHLSGPCRLDEGRRQPLRRIGDAAVRRQRHAASGTRLLPEARRHRPRAHRLFEHLPSDRRHMHAVPVRARQQADLLDLHGHPVGDGGRRHDRPSAVSGRARLAVHDHLLHSGTVAAVDHLLLLDVTVHRSRADNPRRLRRRLLHRRRCVLRAAQAQPLPALVRLP